MTGPDFPSENGALWAVKATQGSDKLHADLTRHCGKSLVATSAVLHCVYLTRKYLRRRIEAPFQVTKPDFSSKNGALSVSKAMQENDESYADLARH